LADVDEVVVRVGWTRGIAGTKKGQRPT
jgi:hypothetical protein